MCGQSLFAFFLDYLLDFRFFLFLATIAVSVLGVSPISEWLSEVMASKSSFTTYL